MRSNGRAIITGMARERDYPMVSTETQHLNPGLEAVGRIQPPGFDFPGGISHAGNGELTLCGLTVGEGGLRLWPGERFGIGPEEWQCPTCRRLAGLG